MNCAFYFSPNTVICLVQGKAHQILSLTMSGIVELLYTMDHIQIEQPL